MRRIHALTGDPPLRRWEGGFEGLTRIVVGQQLSQASASAIWGRLEQRLDRPMVRSFEAASEGDLRGAGLSKGKIATLQGLAAAIRAGAVDLDALDRADDETVHAALRQVRGIGPWTVDIYLLFCLGRADAWAAGDLALQVAMQRVLALDERPGTPAALEIAERWRPWRGVAARLLWSYYASDRKGQSAK